MTVLGATALAGLGRPTMVAALAVVLLMLAGWVLSLRLRDASVVDPLWGPAFVVVAAVCALTGDGEAGRRWLLLACTGVWGLRLGWHLLRRKLADPGEDRRYSAMRERHGSDFAVWSLTVVFGLQALLVLVISLPIQVAADSPDAISALVVPGLLLFVIGFAFEAIGDEQLRRFKADPKHAGEVMDRGLWRYTRHPNYFGDACVWWGIWLIVLQADGTWWTVIAPMVMTFLLVRGSGKELLERDIGQRRPGYADYVERTSGFIPRRPRS